MIGKLLFGDNSNKVSYKDALKDKYYNEGITSNYDMIYGGLNDYLDKNYEGGARKYKADIMQQNTLRQNESTENYKQNRHNYFGNGLIGGILNPIVQTGSSLGDLAIMAGTQGKDNAWDSSKNGLGVARDIGSDIGAGLETAMTLAPMAKGLKLAKATKAVNAANKAGTAIKEGSKLAKQAAMVAKSQLPKTTMQKATMGALLGAGYSGANSLKEMGFENFDPGQLALSAGIGGVTGGALAGIGDMAGKAWGKYTSAKTPVQNTMPYQEALNNLKNNASGGRYSDVATNLPTVRGVDTARVTLDNLDEKTLKNLFTSSLHNAKSKVGGGYDVNSMTSALKNDRKLLQDFLKNGVPSTDSTFVKAGDLREALNNLKNNLSNTKAGNKVSSLLKTKKGKVVAGAGAGLLLAKLLGGGNGGEIDTDNMSDEELYNYIVNGGI